ncbi:MAG: M48 family metalloprotease [Fimbriimonadaceae bacterium]|nr:M48 family metalloprotease [Fimbriimonadaceae bacterium]
MFRWERITTPIIVGTILLVAAELICVILVGISQHVWERRFARQFPRFAHCSTPLWARFAGIYALLVAGGLAYLLALVVPGEVPAPIRLFVIALPPLLLITRVTPYLLRALRVRLPEESPWHELVAETATKCGVKAGQTYMIRSLIANGVALPTGDVITTTALFELLTPQEVSAILAHEYSHRIDRDANRTTLLYLVLFLLLFLSVLIPFFSNLYAHVEDGSVLWVIVILFAGVILAAWASRMAFAIGSRWREYKCDRFAAEKVGAMELATGLAKLHAFLNQPLEWSPLIRFSTTHPSLKERIAALGVDLDQVLISAGVART